MKPIKKIKMEESKAKQRDQAPIVVSNEGYSSEARGVFEVKSK